MVENNRRWMQSQILCHRKVLWSRWIKIHEMEHDVCTHTHMACTCNLSLSRARGTEKASTEFWKRLHIRDAILNQNISCERWSGECDDESFAMWVVCLITCVYYLRWLKQCFRLQNSRTKIRDIVCIIKSSFRFVCAICCYYFL